MRQGRTRKRQGRAIIPILQMAGGRKGVLKYRETDLPKKLGIEP